jgi:hypothetical protein
MRASNTSSLLPNSKRSSDLEPITFPIIELAEISSLISAFYDNGLFATPVLSRGMDRIITTRGEG